jgi:hypothetical protein
MSKSKRKTVSKANTVDLGALQADCEMAAMELRATQDIKIQADRDFMEARDTYSKAGSALESGLHSVMTNCAVLDLVGG